MGTAGRVRGGGGADGNVETPPVRWHPIDTRSHSFKMITLYHRVESRVESATATVPAGRRLLCGRSSLCSALVPICRTKRNGTEHNRRAARWQWDGATLSLCFSKAKRSTWHSMRKRTRTVSNHTYRTAECREEHLAARRDSHRSRVVSCRVASRTRSLRFPAARPASCLV